MPSFVDPLPQDGPRTEKRKSHELGEPESSSNKKQATCVIPPDASGRGTQYWMVQWYASPRIFWSEWNVTMSKEGPSVEETQDVAGRRRSRSDQAERRSHGLGWSRVCVEPLFSLSSETEIDILASRLARLAPTYLRKALRSIWATRSSSLTAPCNPRSIFLGPALAAAALAIHHFPL